MNTRFAPSPTGHLHLGHAFSALKVWETAKKLNGTVLLRIEDTDSSRARDQFEQGIYEDLEWLGLQWQQPVRRQSEHFKDYKSVLDNLAARDLVFPCSCNRRKIQNAGAVLGEDGFVYPGTCQHRSMSDFQSGDAIRLDLAKAISVITSDLSYEEIGSEAPESERIDPNHIIEAIGSPVLLRKETGDAAYHLACVHDDALQGITHVIRGNDVRGLTPIHVVLQKLMGWPTPTYLHHRLIVGEDGKRLAKISKSKAIATYRKAGANPSDIKRLIGFPSS